MSYGDRQVDEILEGKVATMAGVISDLKEEGYTIKQEGGENTIVTGIALSEESVTVERNTNKTVTYTLVYAEGAPVRYFVEVQGKYYEILFNNGNITINTEEANFGEETKEPEVTVESSDSSIIEVTKTDEGILLLTAKDQIGDVEITVKEINSGVTKILNATTKIPATGLTISKTSATVELGKTLQLTATVEPSNTTDEIIWNSSDDSATVTQEGKVTGIRTGTATITVNCGNLSKTCVIRVERFSGINTSETNPEGALPNGVKEIVEANASQGIVIKDKNDREWAWIVVPKTIYKIAQSSTDYTNIKNDLIAYVGIIYRRGSGLQDYNWNDEWYNGCGVANTTTYNTMYNKMLKSVYTNGGFWIQRYEDGRNNINCATAQGYASQMSPDGIKTSSLLFGLQWDLVCKYLEDKGKMAMLDIAYASSNWGRYRSTAGGTPLAGLSRNKRMNIYDFAGNYAEWTLEHATTDANCPCAGRSGSYLDDGTEFPASSRHNHTISSIYINGSFRATFY